MEDNLQIKSERAESFLKELESRNLIKDISNKSSFRAALASGKKIYFGVDPTAPFLHLGHYLGLTLVKRFAKENYKIILLLGGLTARIGDPSLRSNMRSFSGDIDENSQAIQEFLEKYFKDEIKFETVQIINNFDLHNRYIKEELLDWQKQPLNVLLDFVSNISSRVNVSNLFTKDFLKSRLQNGLTVSEMLYPLFQAWDFLRLYLDHDVFIQMGGSDQWGNITVGLDLINRYEFNKNKPISNQEKEIDENDFKNLFIVGFTFPILEDKSGKKIGKSDGNAISITDSDPSAAFMVYQFLINLDDQTALSVFYKLSFLSKDEIDNLWKKDVISAKKHISSQICDDIFGPILERTAEINTIRAVGLVKKLDYKILSVYYNTFPSHHAVFQESHSLFSLFKQIELISSMSEFRRLCKSGGIYVNDVPVTDEKYVVTDKDVYWNVEDKKDGYLYIRKGKKQPGIIHFTIID